MSGSVDTGYERGEPNSWMIVAWGAGAVLALALVIAGIQFYFDRVKEQQVYQKQMEPVSADLVSLRAKEDAHLHSYAYLDRNKGVVRIPIGRAMDLLAKEAAAGKLPYSTKPTPVVAPQAGGADAATSPR